MKSNYAKVIHFNPRSPRGERPIFRVQGAENGKFQSTLPAWGATFLFLPLLRWHVISIHAPRVGSDTISTNADNRYTIFQSTLPAWGATKHLLNRLTFFRISIHAPRVGSDSTWCASISDSRRFQSTLPAWGATAAFLAFGKAKTFQSTLPAWGATSSKPHPRLNKEISIHAPRVGSDIDVDAEGVLPFHISIHAPRVGSDENIAMLFNAIKYFNPRSPRGERPCLFCSRCHARDFNPRSPRGERQPTRLQGRWGGGFQSTLPAWGATGRRLSRTTNPYFNPRSPRGERLQGNPA